jgi:chorismate mutase
VSTRQIDKYRAAIDLLDAQLLRLLNRRAGILKQLGVLKRRAGLPVCDCEREAFLLARLLEKNARPLGERSVISIFHRIIIESRHLQSSRDAGPNSKIYHNGSLRRARS